MPEYRMIPRKQLLPPPDPLRVEMSDERMAELVESIRERGVLFPLLVTPAVRHDLVLNAVGVESAESVVPDGATTYEIIDGHRRWLAAARVALDEVPCMVYESAEDAKHGMMLDANACREDVTAAEEGWQILTLGEKYGWSLEQICSRFHRSEGWVNERVDLVRKDADVAKAVAARLIGVGHAKAINRLKDPERRRVLLHRAVHEGLTAGNLNVMVDDYRRQDEIAAGNPAPHTPPAAVVAEPPAAPRCLWCGGTNNPENMHQVLVHWYELEDLEAVCNQVGLKALRRQIGGLRGA